MEQYCKVVIIDDEFIMRQGMKHMLDWKKEGFQIVGEASNGQEGLEIIEKTNPNIVLADIVMPILDGIEFSEILKKRHPEVQLIMLSSYDKFEYVKTTLLNGAVDYILKPTLNPEILLEVLQRAVKRIPGLELKRQEKGSMHSQMERFLNGYQDKLEETLFAEYFPHTLYRLMGINLKKLCGRDKERMFSAKESISNFFREKKEYVNLHMFLDEEILCCIFNYRVKDEKNVLADMETCVDKTTKMYGKPFFVAGKSFSGMQEIKASYQKEIKPMVNQSFYYKGKSLLVTEIRPNFDKEERFAFAEYSRYLSQKEMRVALEMFVQYISYLCERKVEEYRLKNLTKNLLYNYLMEMEKYEVDSERLRQIYFKKVDDSEYLEEFLQILDEIQREILEICEQKIEVEDIKVLDMKRYIQEHYAEPLELAEIAENFNFNYNYLSSYFTKYAKEGFRDYLNKIRIDKACELLQDGTHSISDISGLVGYSDHSYFCRVFKKITGTTPSAYKRKAGKE